MVVSRWRLAAFPARLGRAQWEARGAVKEEWMTTFALLTDLSETIERWSEAIYQRLGGIKCNA